jgi:hypothetical protein
MAWDDKTPSLVTRTRLLHSSPETVYEALKEYAAYQAQSSLGGYDDELEQALLFRKDPLITLGLAQFGASRKVLSVLYKQTFEGEERNSDYNRALRLGIYGNTLLPEEIFGNGVFGIVGDDELLRFINCSNDAGEEREALSVILKNAGNKKLLGKLYNQEKPFDSIPADKFTRAVFWSHDSPAINDDDSSVHGPDMYAWDVKKGVRRMLSMMPVTEMNMWALYWILKRLDPYQSGMFDVDPRVVIDRWRALELSDNFKKHREPDCSNLDIKQEFLVLIAILYYHYSIDMKSGFIGSVESPDIVLRCAHYCHAKMTPEQMQGYHDKDGDAFVLAAFNNEVLFWKRETRAKLEGMMRWRLIHRYQRRCEQIKRRKPEFDLRPVSDDGVALLEEDAPKQSQELKQLETVQQMVASNANRLALLAKSLQWVFILVIVVIALLIWRPHF